MKNVRHLTSVDRMLSGIERALGTVCGAAVESRPSPAAVQADIHLDDTYTLSLHDALPI